MSSTTFARPSVVTPIALGWVPTLLGAAAVDATLKGTETPNS